MIRPSGSRPPRRAAGRRGVPPRLRGPGRRLRRCSADSCGRLFCSTGRRPIRHRPRVRRRPGHRVPGAPIRTRRLCPRRGRHPVPPGKPACAPGRAHARSAMCWLAVGCCGGGPEGLGGCLVVVDFYSHDGSVADGDGHLAPNMTNDVRDQLARHQQHLGRVVEMIGDGLRDKVASPLGAGRFSRQRDRAILVVSHCPRCSSLLDLDPN